MVSLVVPIAVGGKRGVIRDRLHCGGGGCKGGHIIRDRLWG